MKIQQLSLFLQNEPGHLMKDTDVLERAGVNILALSIGETEEYGVRRMIVNDLDKAQAALKAESFMTKVTDVNCVVTPDVPGALNKALRLLAAEGINVAYMYGYCNAGTAHLIMKTSSTEEADRILETLQ